MEAPSLFKIDLKETLEISEYKFKLKILQEKARKISVQALEEKRAIIVVFEGWDAAGKGGAIRRLIREIDPRLYEVHNISAPELTERTRNYLWRFWNRVPEKGTIGIFDRSWYGRVLVERVEGFAGEEEWKRSYQEIRWFEEDLIDSGIKIIKFFIHIDKVTQAERFLKREKDPLRRWKMTDEDRRNRDKWDSYVEAIEAMLQKTHTQDSPWILVPGNDKYFARINVLEKFIEHCE